MPTWHSPEHYTLETLFERGAFSIHDFMIGVKDRKEAQPGYGSILVVLCILSSGVFLQIFFIFPWFTPLSYIASSAGPSLCL